MKPIVAKDDKDLIVQLAARSVAYEVLRARASELADAEWLKSGEVTQRLIFYSLCEGSAKEAASNCRALLRALTPSYLKQHHPAS